MMEKIAAAKPLKNFLLLPWRANIETNATVEKMERTTNRIPEIFAFSFLGANMRKTNT